MTARRPRGWRDDPAWRHARAVKAGEAARRAHRRRAEARAAGLPPPEAYRVGYSTGYNRAYHYWKAWAARVVAQLRRTEAA